MNNPKITVLDYSPLSIAVVGNTKPIKEDLKGINGSYNPRLTHPDTDNRITGWVFSKRNTGKVITLCKKLLTDGKVSEIAINEDILKTA